MARLARQHSPITGLSLSLSQPPCLLVFEARLYEGGGTRCSHDGRGRSRGIARRVFELCGDAALFSIHKPL